jgi:hypothetical protein
MTRKMTKPSFPYALTSSTLGTVLASVTAVWLVTSAYAPATSLDPASVRHSPSSSFSSHAPYRLSPIPPGADWTS